MKRARRFPRFALLAAACLLSACDKPQTSHQILRPTELGKVRIGMSPEEGGAALSAPLKPFNPNEPGADRACWYTQRIDGTSPEVRYMVQDNKIVRIDIAPGQTNLDASSVATDEGITLDTPEQRVIDQYGSRVRTSPHKYLESGHYLEVASPDGASGILFETVDGKVTTVRAGALDAIRLVEGCS